MPNHNYVSSGAVISKDERYRYHLWREWRSPVLADEQRHWRWIRDNRNAYALDGAGNRIGEPHSMIFVMLNPSTADASIDDPTIRRCVGFARAHNYERIDVLNLFAYRATEPKELFSVVDPVGPDNIDHFKKVVMRWRGPVICAWGAHGHYINQDQTALGWLSGMKIYALKITKGGAPGHPLYLPADSPLIPFARES